MIYRGGGGLSFGLGVVVEMVVVLGVFLELGKSFNGGGRERELPPFVQHPRGSIYRVFWVGEDPVRTGRILDPYNLRSWPFGLPKLVFPIRPSDLGDSKRFSLHLTLPTNLYGRIGEFYPRAQN